MKTNIHPQVFEIEVTCNGCGNRIPLSTTKKEIHVDVCSNCHPLFTGVEKFIDTEGRIEKFQKRASLKVDTKKKETQSKQEAPKTLKEMLEQVRKANS